MPSPINQPNPLGTVDRPLVPYSNPAWRDSTGVSASQLATPPRSLFGGAYGYGSPQVEVNPAGSGGYLWGTTPYQGYTGQPTVYPTSWTYVPNYGYVPRAQPNIVSGGGFGGGGGGYSIGGYGGGFGPQGSLSTAFGSSSPGGMIANALRLMGYKPTRLN